VNQWTSFDDWRAECVRRGFRGPFELFGRAMKDSHQFITNFGTAAIWNGEIGRGFIFDESTTQTEVGEALPPLIRPTSTHTYVLLELSAGAFEEIAVKMREAGYTHVFGTDGEIDMEGIAVIAAPSPLPAGAT
jgi:hypothetical protein